jgi:SAM-dependent methyltransferase
VNASARCIVCAGTRVKPVLRVNDMPVSCNHLCASRESAVSEARAAISLGFCLDCGHVFNLEYDSDRLKYGPGYENSLQGSDQFRRYDDDLVNVLVERYCLRHRRIVEIGCGNGRFLRALCERGRNCGVGFDPSYSRQEDSVGTPGVVIRSEPYGAHMRDLGAEFICSRHTLEHIGDPRQFVRAIRNATSALGVPVFFEVPNGLYTLRDGGIWDIIYEHCSYFTPSSLKRLFGYGDYAQLEVEQTFGGQFLTLHARTGVTNELSQNTPTSDLEKVIESFGESHRGKLEEWASRLARLDSEGRKVIVWGAGAKAATFLNLLRPTAIESVVDVNPRKHGHYITGTGQRIVPPAFLRKCDPDVIICMNPNYRDEISRHVSELGIRADLICA